MRGRDTNTSLSHTRQTPNVQVDQCTHFLMNSVGLVFVSVFFVVVVVITLLHRYAEQLNFGKIKQHWFKFL